MKYSFFHFSLTKDQFLTCHSSASYVNFCITLIYSTIAYAHQVSEYLTQYIKYAAIKSTSEIKTVFSLHNEEYNPWQILFDMTKEKLSWIYIDKTIKKTSIFLLASNFFWVYTSVFIDHSKFFYHNMVQQAYSENMSLIDCA